MRRVIIMPKFVIEREVPGAGSLSGAELRAMSQTSVETLDGMAGRAQWIQSYVTDDKIFCVYIADDVEAVREHATTAGFPCNAVSAVRTMIDATTAEA